MCLGSIFASKMYLVTTCKRVDLAVIILRIVVSESGFGYNNLTTRYDEGPRGKE